MKCVQRVCHPSSKMGKGRLAHFSPKCSAINPFFCMLWLLIVSLPWMHDMCLFSVIVVCFWLGQHSLVYSNTFKASELLMCWYFEGYFFCVATCPILAALLAVFLCSAIWLQLFKWGHCENFGNFPISLKLGGHGKESNHGILKLHHTPRLFITYPWAVHSLVLVSEG